MAVTFADVVAARANLGGVALHTPIVPSAHLSESFGGDVVLKAENLQRTGSFKIRGAMNVLAHLGGSARHGVVAGSAGNHAQGLALAARVHGVPCEIHVPAGASLSKVESCRGYGATVVEGGDSVDSAVAQAQARAAAEGMVFCHPYDAERTVAGQGTLGLEVVEDVGDLSLVVVPLGGGGLTAGLAIAVRERAPSARIVAVQASACAPYAGGPVPDGPVATLADGIAVKRPGAVTAPIIERLVDEVVVVGEDAIADAMVLLIERGKMVVEGGGAVGVAALMTGAVVPPARGRTCVVLSGGNLDVGLLPNLIRRHETGAGRRLVIVVRIPDRPGALAGVLQVCGAFGANVIEVQHHRDGVELHARETIVQLVLETRGIGHSTALCDELVARGYGVSADLPRGNSPHSAER